jgi:hypothetical protein
MLTREQRERFEKLKGPWCSHELILELYGLDLVRDQALQGALLSWGERLKRPGNETVRPGRIHRHHLETFFQIRKLLPLKLAAVRLGMDADSLVRVEEALKERGFYLRSALSDQLVMEPQLREITQFLPSLSSRIFSNHSSFCLRLHEAIAQELNFKVGALRCVTSLALGEEPPQYADEFDAITLEPIGVQYQVWLDFQKPMHLKPDCCATKTYVENQELLRGYLFAGEQPELPAGLIHP